VQRRPLRHRASRTQRLLVATFAALTLGGVLTACSSDDDGSDDGAASVTTTTVAAPELSAEEETALDTEVKWTQCMRDNGIHGLPDPQVTEDGFLLIGFPVVLPENWNEAQEACQSVHDDAAASEESAGGDATASWEKVVPGGDCHCADGSEFAFWERRADPNKVVFFLDGGGNCFDATSCAFTGLSAGGEPANYDWSVWGEDPAQEGGIFDFARADNPFLDYSFIYVPSCTGDLHLGDATREYSPELTVEHNGFVNGTASLDYLAEHYSDAAQVVVVGKSNGSAAAPIYGGLAADLLPDAHVTVFGANSGAFPDDPDLIAEVGELWGAYGTMPDWEVNRGLTARDWGPTRFWIQAGLHNPELVLARFDFAYDREVAEGAAEMGLDPSQSLAVIDAHEAAIEAAGVIQHSYTAAGDGHTILEDDHFYETDVDGVTLVEWVDALITGNALEDVHCDQCETL
jgi:Pectinacetylesterase